MRTDPIRRRWRDRKTGDAESADSRLEAMASDLFRAVPPPGDRTSLASASLLAQLRKRRRPWFLVSWQILGLRPLAMAFSLLVSLNLALAVTVTPVKQWWSRVLQVEADQSRSPHRNEKAPARSNRASSPVVTPLDAQEIASPVVAPPSPESIPMVEAPEGSIHREPAIENLEPPRPARHLVRHIASREPRPAPEQSPAPAVAAPLMAPPQPKSDALAGESGLLSRALAALGAGQPSQALEAVAAYRSRFPQGRLTYEATLAEVKAQLAEGHDRLARAALEQAMALPDFDGLPRSSELTVLHAELQARMKDCAEALPTFDRLARSPDLDAPLAERALYGRASCLASQADRTGARKALEVYLRRFPEGRFAQAARAALSASE